MPDVALLGPWVRRFLLEHLVGERNLARNTQQSYRDTLTLLLPHVSAHSKKPLDQLQVPDLSVGMIRGFLDFLERERNCSVRTRNQRLAAIHAMARFIGERCPEYIAWCGEIQTVPFKRFERPMLPYLDKPEIDSILAAPNRAIPQGFRDYVLLLFLYNSGARVSEAASLSIGDLALRDSATCSVKLFGKGGKTRSCPLWKATVKELAVLTRNRTADQRVFLNRLGQPLTRHGIHALLRRYVAAASVKCPSLQKKRISPHTIRHTTATHLLRSGVDINTVRDWLGHVSIDTTNIYVEIDLEKKAEMLAQCNTFKSKERGGRRWRDDPSLMAFLRSL